ncbi:MAG: hypothetical protein RIS44_1199 [Pseudomonadota bacterium]|jgi:hypothetical protein
MESIFRQACHELCALARIFHRGCARVGCGAVRWQGATTLRARAREEEQRSKRAAAWLNRLCSARYKLDLALEANKVSIHAVLQGIGKRPGEYPGQMGRAHVAGLAAARAGSVHTRCGRPRPLQSVHPASLQSHHYPWHRKRPTCFSVRRANWPPHETWQARCQRRHGLGRARGGGPGWWGYRPGSGWEQS